MSLIGQTNYYKYFVEDNISNKGLSFFFKSAKAESGKQPPIPNFIQLEDTRAYF